MKQKEIEKERRRLLQIRKQCYAKYLAACEKAYRHFEWNEYDLKMKAYEKVKAARKRWDDSSTAIDEWEVKHPPLWREMLSEIYSQAWNEWQAAYDEAYDAKDKGDCNLLAEATKKEEAAEKRLDDVRRALREYEGKRSLA